MRMETVGRAERYASPPSPPPRLEPSWNTPPPLGPHGNIQGHRQPASNQLVQETAGGGIRLNSSGLLSSVCVCVCGGGGVKKWPAEPERGCAGIRIRCETARDAK